MPGKIFINYRRYDDAGHAAGRLFDHLQQAFQPDQLFMDVDSIRPGLDFVKVLEDQVAQCDIVLTVIGQNWINARDEAGKRRLDNPEDFVRIEIESAIAQNKRVIPILIGSASMPRSDELPETMKPLARRNAVRLTHERFRADTQGLIKALQEGLQEFESARRAEAEATRQAQADEERRQAEEAARKQADSEREAEERARREKEQARLNAIAGLSPEQIARAEELANWDFIKESTRPQDFRDHLARFPSGVCERMARHKLAVLAWAELGKAPNKAQLEEYLEECPASPHAEEARTRLAALERRVQGRAPRQMRDAAEQAVKREGEATRVWTSESWKALRRTLLISFALGGVVGTLIAIWIATTTVPTQAPVKNEQPATPSIPAGADAPLSMDRERALKPKDTFKECANCPEMIVIPAGSFTMGSPASETGRNEDEGPQHAVTLAKRFALGRFAVTFDEWDACVADSGCNNYHPSDQGWGRGRRPAINVNWDDAKAYTVWLSRKTGKTYRLLSEAEYEYAARAGTTTTYPWGNAIGKGNANCDGCGSQWDHKQTAPVGSFAANAFGVYDMSGNVYQWVEDCHHDSYQGAPKDASPWSARECSRRVIRGGSWANTPQVLRSASRNWTPPDNRDNIFGFRVVRSLTP